ncbi:hypothetical protein FA95DRAFT_1562900 [Auriscalpium vulgare]|uniref:Uncharacterized protein n=1 Tax=Auriscalpium vulgare TaxID=40419 RepID=A0ACB8RIE8_9AGAM|nr:hypothetical protein FA95DRAFT_1562900 [Auriscalpium vulgare]
MADPLEVERKLAVARDKKDEGDKAFKAGSLQPALRAYHESLMYLQGIDKSGLKNAFQPAPSLTDSADPPQEKTEVDEMVEKIYANMSACHIKQENWRRAHETADKALAKNPDNYKALFRKGKAFGELGYFERAEGILQDLAKKSTADAAAANAEIARLRALDKERDREQTRKLKGWLNRASKTTPLGPTASDSDATLVGSSSKNSVSDSDAKPAVEKAFIEEV